MGIVAHTVFPHPHGAHTGIAHQLHGAMGYPGSRTQQQHGNGSRRNVNDPIFICHRNGAVLSSQRAVLQIEKRHPVFDLGQRLQVRPNQSGIIRHGSLFPSSP